MEDFVLLATVDGQIHARDRDTGRERWSFSVGRPMVETSYDYQNISEDDPDSETFKEMPLWIVEPSQDGNLYVYSHGSAGIQKLGMTVRALAEDLSPYAGEDPPVVYTAEKKTTLYTVDARSGTILKRFSSGGSSIFNDTNCERPSDFVLSNRECKGTLTLGQTEYVVAIQSRDTGRPVCTIKYFEWTPNLRDRDLHSQYLSTMDNKYVYSRFDGTVFALDHTTHRKIYPQRPVYTKKFSSPVVRVFDVARPYHDDSDDPALIILPQPVGPASVEEIVEDVWVNCTEAGTWYAMSEFSYPAVTDGASKARCYSQDSTDLFAWDGRKVLPESKALVGVHSLASSGDYLTADYPTISPPEAVDVNVNGAPPEASPIESTPDPSTRHTGSWFATGAGTVIALLLVSWILQNPRVLEMLAPLNKLLARKGMTPPPVLVQVSEPVAPELTPLPEPVEERRVRFAEPDEAAPVEEPAAEDPELTTDDATGETNVEASSEADVEGNGDDEGSAEGDKTTDGESAQETPKKKKAHRGQRGGRKRRKSTKSSTEEGAQDEIGKIVEQVKNMGQVQSVQPDTITVAGESVTDIANNIKRYVMGILELISDLR